MLDRRPRSIRLSRRSAAAAAALLLAAAFAILAHEAMERELLSFDQPAHDSVRAWRQPGLDASMRAVSVLGSGWLLVPLNVLLVWILRRRGYRSPLLVPALTLGAVATEVLVKWLVNRPRPKAVGYGFPSGHVMVALVFFGLVLYLLWQARRGDAVAWLATLVGIVAVAAIGVSRIYLNAHWLSDVLGAIAAGLTFLIVVVLRFGPALCARDPARVAPASIGVATLRARWLAAAAGAAALALVDTGARMLTSNDEARFPVLAQAILSGGDWLVPSLNGAPYVNKPPLLAWAIAAASWPFGQVTQFTVVVPSLLAAAVVVFAVYRLGREMWGATAGGYAAAVAATTQGLFVYARVPMPDMLLTAFGTLSLWALHRMRGRRPGLAWVGFYAALAGAFWTKGPAGLMPLGVALVYARWRRRCLPPGWLRLAPGLLLLAALAAPWIAAASLRDADALHRTVAADYIAWYLPHQMSIGTLIAPLEHLLGLVVPWAWLVPFALYDAWRQRRGQGAERDAVLLVLLWVALEFALVALSAQQRARYYLPLVPPLSLLLGWWLAGAAIQRRALSLWPFRWTAALVGTGAAVAILWSATQGRLLRDAPLPTSLGEVVLIVGAGATLVLALEGGLRGGRAGRAMPVAVVAAAVLVAALNHVEQRARNAGADYADLLRRVATMRAAGEPITTVGVPALPIAFYLGERVTALEPDAVARGAWAAPGTIVIAADSPALDAQSASIEVAGRARLGRQHVVIGRVTGPLAAVPAGAVVTPVRHGTAWTPAAIRHLAFELLCVVIAVAAVVARTYAVRHRTPRAAVYGAEATIILSVASFPANAWVFAGGIGVAAVCAYLRWRRPMPADHPHVWVSVLLMLALPLDILEDLLQGKPVTLDPLWVAAVLLGAVLLTWHRVRPAAT